ncbi:MAG: BolA family protein, partial [Sphingomonadaceae bacterium]|nr:BolA family protein [Sphingomonadaceae bacterium]
MGAVAQEIERRLQAALSPDRLEIQDDSAKHAGHAGHRGDAAESHFTVRLTSAAFAGQNRVARQRAVYAALGDLIAPDRVHALSIEAKAPG